MNVQNNNKTILTLRELNADEKMRYFADMREKALHDEATALQDAREEGVMQGREEGIEEGRMQGREEGRMQGREEGTRQIVEKMRKSGMTEEQIQAILKQ